MDINLVIHAKDYIDDLARGINPITKENTNENDVRVTVIIGTRQKCSIKAIFVAFAVALRQQGCHLKTTNLIFTPSIF